MLQIGSTSEKKGIDMVIPGVLAAVTIHYIEVMPELETEVDVFPRSKCTIPDGGNRHRERCPGPIVEYLLRERLLGVNRTHTLDEGRR